MADELTVALVLPDLLGLYADRGNAVALRHRAALHHLDVTVLEVNAGQAVPESADIYLLGGAEDAAMEAAHLQLRDSQGFAGAIRRGAPVLAVCAGLQLLAESYSRADGVVVPGLGHLNVSCRRSPGPRMVGEVVVQPRDPGPLVLGFENHQGDATLGPDAMPLGTVVHGAGNGVAGLEGAVQGAILATYLHGPVLVRNPALCDRLLAAAVGRELTPVEDLPVERLRAERIGFLDAVLS